MHSYGFCDVRGVDVAEKRAAAVRCLRSGNVTDIAALFPNNVVGLTAAIVRSAVADNADVLDACAQLFVRTVDGDRVSLPLLSIDDTDDDAVIDDEQVWKQLIDMAEQSSKNDDKMSGSDDEIDDDEQVDAEHEDDEENDQEEDEENDDDEDEDEEEESAPDLFDVRLLLFDEFTVCIDFRLALLLRIVSSTAKERDDLRTNGVPLQWLRSIGSSRLFGDVLDADRDDEHEPIDQVISRVCVDNDVVVSFSVYSI